MCERKCAFSHYGLTAKEAKAAGIKLFSRNKVIKVKDPKKSASLMCMQCEDAACVRACPLGVIHVENGIVRVNEEDCIGCGTCAMVCPVGAINVHDVQDPETGRSQPIALKCDLCYDKETQACIAGCKFKALSIVSWEEYRAANPSKE
ncbi:4Fe-4S dicluster domain-containing protein [Desulfocapsa sp. AH-315-G09]|nr:4Fe-4S dicluster domain-containing protein [Desulfocapsa sp. AH-315-G09]